MIQDHPWMWHWGGMWFFPMVMFALMIIFIFIGRRGCRPPWWYPESHHDKNRDADSALDILKKRYAKGEIDKEEFEEMKKEILE